MSQKNESEIRIRNVGKKSHDEFMNICDHLQTNASALLKPKVIEIIQSYPPEMRLPKPKED